MTVVARTACMVGSAPMRCKLGFTLVEMLVTLALVGIAAAVVLPLAQLAQTRADEAELRRALRTLRTAIDAYKQAADSGLIERATGSSGYPPSLESLTDGVPRSAAFGISSTPVVFLRRIPRDPLYPDRETPAHQTWNLRSYGAKADDFTPGPDVFDVSSKSARQALDGTAYSQW